MDATTDGEYQSLPIYWFAVLGTALDDGDLISAGRAVRKLRAMGIIVTVPHIAARAAAEAVARG